MGDDNLSTDPIRLSVFDRLTSVDQSNDLGNGERSSLTFSKAVGRSVATDFNFYPLADKKQAHVSIPIEMAKEAAKAYNSVLYGYFLGPRIPFPLVKKFVKQAWGKFGFLDAMLNENGIFFFKFNDVGGCDQVIETGPLMIRGVPLFVHRWDPSKGLKKPKHSSCPLWVKLHNIPLVAFNKEGVSRIASVLGIPKQMDSCTASMCEKAWGRRGFAKVLVEVWAVGDLKRKIDVEIPNINGGEPDSVQIQVEYLWEPIQCTHCQIFGHKLSSCVRAASLNKDKQIVSRKDADGFTRVTKKQWRVKGGNKTELSSAQTDNGRKESNPIDAPLGVNAVSQGREMEGFY
ncbi:uncharacterized protein LOC112505167 [Cynara cardunculus var. scolymus]|uniref:uncharacterized protein LOC112505167 n=1 Tax=Cynara cardunculus var. scolymus TaxID=59895 RepID=UPI000D627A5D|nr:uncharacterized protein LOC112505167 [Cynara cardunculus var. scolymus]